METYEDPKRPYLSRPRSVLHLVDGAACKALPLSVCTDVWTVRIHTSKPTPFSCCGIGDEAWLAAAWSAASASAR